MGWELQIAKAKRMADFGDEEYKTMVRFKQHAKPVLSYSHPASPSFTVLCGAWQCLWVALLGTRPVLHLVTDSDS